MGGKTGKHFGMDALPNPVLKTLEKSAANA
jgi:hypothetical protein